jgi:adenylosuccinate lyase
MSGAGLASEGFKEGQVGSSAMPHKMNARSSERINGLAVVLKGYLSMISEITGDQWNEGDVSCSVVRRVALPDAFFTLDGINQTFATILLEMNVFEERLSIEVENELPFVSTTRLLVEATKRGLGREDAHKIIQNHSLAAYKMLQSGKFHSFVQELGDDPTFPLNVDEVKLILQDVKSSIGNTRSQLQNLSEKLDQVPLAKTFVFELKR